MSGTIISILFSNALNDMIVYGRLTTQLTDPGALIGNIFTQDKLGQLFLLLEALVVLICIVYFVCAKRTYQADTYAVTDNLSIPVPYGQGQHGTTWFMSEKEKKEVFDYIKISPMNPLVSKLVALGKERYEAIENGEEYTPPKLDKTLCKSGGIVLAREMSGDTECLPCITDDIHTLTIGATRSGKSRCLVLQSICTIALAGEGIVVNDPKGELYHYTHCYLESLGYTVRVVDFNSPQKSSHYNPLQVIIDDVNKGNLDAAQRSMWDFVTFLVEKNDHTEPIWTNGECAVIAAAVMCVVYDNKDHPEFQNLTNVYNFIANMCKTVNKVMPIDAYMNKLPDSHPAKSLMAIAKIAPDKMGGSFFTSALTTLRLYITNDMYNITKESEFSFEDMVAKPKQALFYLLPDQKTTYYPIVSLLVAQQYEQLVTYAKTQGNRLPNRVNFILDEFGNFTAIPDIQSKMTVGGGYGIRWNLFIQDFNQLIDKYGQEVAKIIQSNCHFWIYLHSQDNSTNKEISDRLGKYTTSTYSLGGTTQKYAAPSSSTNIQLSERSLLFPDEVALIQRPYQIVTSIYKPVVMKSPDISQWMFNIMLEFFGLIMPISYGVGISLIILKFLKKAFDIYVLWTDGDPDADPFLLLTNFVRAVGTALIFQWLYGLFVDIFRDITNTIIERINSNCNPTVEWVNSITSLGIVPAICGLIFIICYLILLLSFMARGIEMMVIYDFGSKKPTDFSGFDKIYVVGGTSWNELPMIYDIQNDLNMVNYTVAVNFSDETSVEKNRELLSVNLNDVICLPYAPDPFSLTAGYEEIFDKDFVEWADSPAEEADLSAEK